MEIIIAALFIVVLIIITLFYNALSWGFVVSKFYLWFVVSMYPEAPQFTIMQFIGVMFFLSAILPKMHTKAIKKEYCDNGSELIGLLLAPWVSLLCGGLIHIAY